MTISDGPVSREERARVAELLGYWPGEGAHDRVAMGQGDPINGLHPEDVDRVALALREAFAEGTRYADMLAKAKP